MCHKLRERAKEMFSFGERPKLKKSTLSTHTDVVEHVSAVYADRIALDMTLSQALLAFAKGFDTPPKCKNPACTCQTPWKQGTFQETCSRSCANKVVTGVGKCVVCGTEYPIVKAATHALTCSSECGSFYKHHKMSAETIAKAKQDFKSLGLVDWSNRYLCRALDNGGYGYNEIRFGNVSWAKINDLVEEVAAVNIAIMEFSLFSPVVLSTKDKWKAWQLGSSYRTCAHCGGVGKFHETRGWQEFCSNDCQRAAIAAQGSELRNRIISRHAETDQNVRLERYESTMVERYGYRSNLAHRPTIDRIMVTKRLNSPHWGRSTLEMRLVESLRALGVTVVTNDRTLIGSELDLYLPEHNLAIEVNGVIYHSEKYRKNAKTCHLEKTLRCNERGIHLVHIWHDELNSEHRFERVMKRLKWLLKLQGIEKRSARQFSVGYYTEKSNDGDIKRLLDLNHAQGHAKNYTEAYTLEGDRGDLAAVMLFKVVNGTTYELSRFYADCVVGAFTKLLTHFKRTHPEARIISYGDRDKLDPNRNVYTVNGFTLVDTLPPDYKYTNGGGRIHKFNFRKSRLLAKHPELDPNMTEFEMATKLGYYRVWNTGLFVYEYNK